MWTEVVGQGFALHNHLRLSNITTLDACKTQCLAQPDFLCRSIDYDSDNHLCMLSKYRLSDATEYALKFEAKISHFDWSCTDGMSLFNLEEPNACQSTKLVSWNFWKAAGKCILRFDEVWLKNILFHLILSFIFPFFISFLCPPCLHWTLGGKWVFLLQIVATTRTWHGIGLRTPQLLRTISRFSRIPGWKKNVVSYA